MIAGFCLTLAACNGPSVVLMKNPSAITWAAMDSIAYALIQGKWTADAWVSRRVDGRPVNYAVPMCNASQLQHITPEMWGTAACLLAVSRRDDDCENSSGCVAMAFHPSVVEDQVLWARIVRSLDNLCDNIPQEGGHAWSGFSYDPVQARHLLGCVGSRPRFVKRVVLWVSEKPALIVNFR